MIRGLSRRTSMIATILSLAACGGGGGGGGTPAPTPAPPPAVNTTPVAVTVTATATDPKGAPLSYRWRATSGSIVDQNAASTTWTLPAGPGLHSAYVLVANGRGGYAEARVLVSTDDLGVSQTASPTAAFDAPAAPAAASVYAASIRGAGSYVDDGVYLPDISVYLQQTAPGTTAQSARVSTDLRGQFSITDIGAGTWTVKCRQVATDPYDDCDSGIVTGVNAVVDPYMGPTGLASGGIAGRVVMSDGAPCGLVSEYFGVQAAGTVSILNASSAVIAGPYRLNAWGHFNLPAFTGASTMRIQCEGSTPRTVALPTGGATPRITLSDTAAPLVSALVATTGATTLGTKVAPPSMPSATLIPDPYFYLTARGIDSRLSACQYYLAIGAVKGCGSDGSLQSPVSFDDWRAKMQLAPFAGAGTEVQATFINRVDLNLTRRHHSVSTAAGRLAAYVCNHKGPADETQAAIDTAIDDAVSGRNLVACVAMDHGTTAGVNGGAAFTRFFAFDGGGRLLSSVNLDGRGEKFVPGTCVACHGGDKYGGRYRSTAGGSPDLGAHFLPYDIGSYLFSSKAGLRAADQQAAIKQLNLNLLQAAPTTAVSELIAGWYAGGAATQNVDYLPASWSGTSAAAREFYSKVWARSCRTCHVAQREALNFDRYPNVTATDPAPPGQFGYHRIAVSVCKGSVSHLRNYSMPNSLRTHALFWASAGTAVDQPAITAAFVGPLEGGTIPCTLEANPGP